MKLSKYGNETMMTRRTLLKQMAAAAAMTTAAVLFPGVIFAREDQERAMRATLAQQNVAADELEWKKAPCRFCGVGCGLLIGINKERAVAVKGDPTSPVNKGLCCVKGYHSVMALYGADRLQKAYVRKEGKLVETPISQALDLVAQKMQETIAEHGKDAISIYGSGQWTIPDGYVANKLFKGAIGTNNVEANARLCMASAVTGFMTGFGLDEPMGCYDDIDHADVFVLWGNNMAEMHPVLFSRMLEQRQQREHVQIIDLATRTTRTSMAADRSILFRPQTDLAIANAICYEIIRNDWVHETFVERHCTFRAGKTDIGYGMEDGFAFSDEPMPLSFDEFKEFLQDYTPEKVEQLSGMSARDIRSDYWIEDITLNKLALVATVAAQINLIMLGSELFTEFYAPTHHNQSATYLFFGLRGKDSLLPWIWSAIGMNVVATLTLTLHPLRRQALFRNLACALLFVAIWIKKGMGLIVPGFIPGP